LKTIVALDDLMTKLPPVTRDDLEHHAQLGACSGMLDNVVLKDLLGKN
jgi:hypothetical protein